MILTKTTFISFLTSPLHAWAAAHGALENEKLTVFDQHLVNQGYVVEKLAKEYLEKYILPRYPGGSTIEYEVTLNDGAYQSRVDALIHDVITNTYDIYEIKSSTTFHAKHKYDVTFQYLVGKSSLAVKHVFLVRVNNEYCRQGEFDVSLFIKLDNMKLVIEELTEKVELLRTEALSVINATTPPTNSHCLKPASCVCPHLCFPELQAFSIFELSRGSQTQSQELLSQGIAQLQDIPDSYPLTYKQRLQVTSIKTQQPIIDQTAIQHELKQLQFPLYFLDYETFASAVPLYDGYCAHQHMTFQYSLHVVSHPENMQMEHYEFLADQTEDPSSELVQNLCQQIGSTGSVIVWNKGFECSRNRELALLQPKFADQLAEINDRTYDLMDIFAQGLYVDFRFHGSASIKKVLPVLVPELQYQDLAISEGATAMIKWYEMVYGNLTPSECEVTKTNLLKYCQLDTLAMVKIWQQVMKI